MSGHHNRLMLGEQERADDPLDNKDDDEDDIKALLNLPCLRMNR